MDRDDGVIDRLLGKVVDRIVERLRERSLERVLTRSVDHAVDRVVDRVSSAVDLVRVISGVVLLAGGVVPSMVDGASSRDESPDRGNGDRVAMVWEDED